MSFPGVQDQKTGFVFAQTSPRVMRTFSEVFASQPWRSILVEKRHGHPGIQDEGELPDLIPIGEDGILIVDCLVAGDFRDLDIVVDGREKHFGMSPEFIGLLTADQAAFPIHIHAFQEIQAAGISVVV
jgi:hypothetical protein